MQLRPEKKMNFDRYELYTSTDFLEYEFYSRGAKGVIRKIVRYTRLSPYNTRYFNLGFGDWSESENRINDVVVTNNGDTEKVLATIAYTVIQFTQYYSEALIYAQGSTPSRTRLYQMGINKIKNRIEEDFNLYGYIEDEGFYPFEWNKNYQAFLISKKNQ